MDQDFLSAQGSNSLVSSTVSTYGVSSPVAAPATKPRPNPFLKRRALEICEEAQKLHLEGKTAKAIPIYGKSIRLCPTAEAHAFLGWAYSAHFRYDLAIRECMAAIEIDPEYGNSYNDIGSYLVSQGKLDESVEWFEKAKKAGRYASKYFPYMNLGRVFSAKGLKLRAIREFERALELNPGEESCASALKRLRSSLVAKTSA
jgi:Tfp pilus assembly protein PilF